MTDTDIGRIERMVALAREHAAAESRGDVEGTLATLESDCLYELQPAGLAFRGLDAAAAAYRHFFAEFSPRSTGTLVQEWYSEDCLGQEYRIDHVSPDGERSTHSVIGIITFGRNLLSGERIYATEALQRLMYGNQVVDDAVPLGPAFDGN
ncbi:ketosteroid isomerase-like protein [Rhodococcus sp. OK519]|uniref:nuclear transport factor 2 family protein n=1 Tax=Rhodococcus sp. OK519 TaxID=2135729 RepID=UPI000D395A9E|nr:ketosteroid isomerase-like protein [Rhodococcus sp. OK519]